MDIFKKYFYKRKGRLTLIFSLLICSTLLAAPGPYYIKVIVDDVLLKGETRTLYLLISIVIVIIMLQIAFSIFQSFKVGEFVQDLLIEMRQDLYQRLFKIEYSSFNKRSRGEYLTRIISDVEIVGSTLTSVIINLLVNSLIVIMYLSIALFINWKLSLIGILSLPLFVKLINKFGEKLRFLSSDLQQIKSKVLSNLEEDFTGIKHILLKNAIKQRFNLYTEGLKHSAKLSIEVSIWSSLLSCLSSLIAVVGPLCTLVLGVHFVKNGELTTGSLLAFYGYIGSLYQPVSQISSVIPQLHIMRASAQRLKEIFELPVKERDLLIEICTTENSIIFEDVSYTTEDGTQLLKGVSFEIESGCITRISGASGAGKTTLLNLLMGIIQPTNGKIMCSEISWENLSQESISKKIAFVSQDYFLFTGKVIDNLTLGLENVSFFEVKKACEISGIHNEIELLPQQYNTWIGQNGVAMSGGQIQRIMIARALLQKPGILVLDEATSELDAENESKIFNQIDKNFSGISIVIVTHKLNENLKVSKEYKLFNGVLVEAIGL